MRSEREKAGFVIAALGIVLVAIVAIILHAIHILDHPQEASQGAIETEAQDEIWAGEASLSSNRDIAVSLKEAVLGESTREKKLVVFSQSLSDIIKVTDEGALPFQLSAKYRYIKYSGTASYTVDLAALDEGHLRVDEDEKTLTIVVPRAVEELSINEEETQADATEKIGIFSIGDLKLTEEERIEVIAEVKQNMESKLKEEKTSELADRMARMSVWEIYQPVVSKVAPEYTVKVEFE